MTIFLSDDIWGDHHQLPEEDKIELTKPFSESEMKEAIWGMKNESAPGPNGYGVKFLKTFWDTIKADYIRMFTDFHAECLDIKRLNYGVITLVPKVNGGQQD